MTDPILKHFCDTTLTEAAKAMENAGADVELILDRLLTFCGAQMVAATNKGAAATAFRHCADSVENGVFDHLEDCARALRN